VRAFKEKEFQKVGGESPPRGRRASHCSRIVKTLLLPSGKKRVRKKKPAEAECKAKMAPLVLIIVGRIKIAQAI